MMTNFPLVHNFHFSGQVGFHCAKSASGSGLSNVFPFLVRFGFVCRDEKCKNLHYFCNVKFIDVGAIENEISTNFFTSDRTVNAHTPRVKLHLFEKSVHRIFRIVCSSFRERRDQFEKPFPLSLFRNWGFFLNFS